MSDYKDIEKNSPKAVVHKLPADNAASGPLTGPLETDSKPTKKGKAKAFFKNRYALVNLVMVAGNVWEPIRNWTVENPEAYLSILGTVNFIMHKFFGKKLYGDEEVKKKADENAKK